MTLLCENLSYGNDDDVYMLINGKKKKNPKKEVRIFVIRNAHHLGHFGIKATIERMKEKYFWNNMQAKIQKLLKKCRICLRHNSGPGLETTAKSIKVSYLFERIGIDLVFGLPLTKEGFNGICVITEYLTRYPYAVPIKGNTAEEIARVLLEYVALFGPPQEILTDQGK